ncbi:Protein of unknown function [Lampropedia hyalina DSM 16112]|jgi:hypothetical protein|uniref:DUF1631 family protein n=1 Tax=Lampropedia hyalina DSM 16112 TaxID=1122156 RepID=A0A1M5EPZ7_9BURK|nr:DUF1631 family protein [Lampropedia hyalina]SHF81378.1 Protein of unknown function [Lampropedia hyalina DSM 16112]
MTTASEACWTEITRTVATAMLDSNRLLQRLLQQTHQRLAQQRAAHPIQQGTAAPTLWWQAQQLLEQHQSEWEQSFCHYLLEECSQSATALPPPTPHHSLASDLDALDWGDGLHIQAQAEFAQWRKRIETHLHLPLRDLQHIIAAAHGLSPWHSIHNPLHPSHYLLAMEKMVCQSQAHMAVCQWLLRQMYADLTPLLEHTYRSAITRLSESGACDAALAAATSARTHTRSSPPTWPWSKALLAEYLNSPPQPTTHAALPPVVVPGAAPVIPNPASPPSLPYPRYSLNAPAQVHGTPPSAELPDTLRMGAWFRIGTGSRAVLSRLSWNSHDRSVFLFTSADGRSQTMTRRRLLHLLQNDELQPSAAP